MTTGRTLQRVIIAVMLALCWCTPATAQTAPQLVDQSSFGATISYEYETTEDTSTWINAWGTPTMRFSVTVVDPAYATSGPQPLCVELHSAGSAGFQTTMGPTWPCPGWSSPPSSTFRGIGLRLRDNTIPAGVDPYAPNGYGYSYFFGRGIDSPIAYSTTEKRMRRYIAFAIAHYNIDPNQVYLVGGSLGGGGTMTMCRHMADIFAACHSMLGWVDPFVLARTAPNTGWPEYLNKHVDAPNGPLWQDHMDNVKLAQQATIAVPFRYEFAKNDTSVPPLRYDELAAAVEAAKLPYAMGWNDGDHRADSPLDNYLHWGSWHGVYLSNQFTRGEIIPAFANASINDPYSVANGQRNGPLNWGSTKHPIGDPIVDTATTLAITLQSLTVNATADTTIRNAIQFAPAPGELVTWTTATQSGSVAADARGLVTISALAILTTPTRLTLTKSGNIPPPPPPPPPPPDPTPQPVTVTTIVMPDGTLRFVATDGRAWGDVPRVP